MEPIKLAKRDTTILSSPFEFQFIATTLSRNQIQRLINTSRQQYRTLTDFIGQTPHQKVIYQIFPSTEEKGLSTRDTRPSSVQFEQNKIQIVSNDYFKGADELAQNEWTIRSVLGSPKMLCLQKGLAGLFAPNWLPGGYTHLAKKIAQSDNLPELSEIIDQELFQKESPILMNICATSLVDFLIKKWGKKTFLLRYSNWQPSKNEIKNLDAEWKKFILNNYSASKVEFTSFETPIHGFNFAHEGYRIYNGYGSKLAKASLDTLSSIGINAIAIVPYSYMRDQYRPTFLPLMDRAGSETDESVIVTHLQAKEKQLTTLLKPQIWVHKSWPGAIEMKSEKDWDLFFDYYYRWIRHYAILAEVYQIDLFCIGVELSKATITHPEKWAQLITKIRGIYSGQLTYAANWGEEFEQLAFANQLDLIGINCYYPISPKKRPGKEELKKGFKKIAKKINQKATQVGKPILFTEIGFRSIDAPWIQPHEEHQGQNISEEDQALCYQIVLEELEGKSWCTGIFWWKWPSYLDYMGKENSGFSPNRKLAEKVFKQFHY